MPVDSDSLISRSKHSSWIHISYHDRLDRFIKNIVTTIQASSYTGLTGIAMGGTKKSTNKLDRFIATFFYNAPPYSRWSGTTASWRTPSTTGAIFPAPTSRRSRSDSSRPPAPSSPSTPTRWRGSARPSAAMATPCRNPPSAWQTVRPPKHYSGLFGWVAPGASLPRFPGLLGLLDFDLKIA